jgi:phosphohistidine phosphatase
MHLLVVRHGIAEERRPDQEDAARRLTREGERRFRRVVRGLRGLGWKLDRVLTSPWVRAASTAEMLASLGASPTATDLLCQPPSAALLALIAESSGIPRKLHATAVVGHEPWLSELVALLALGEGRRGDAFSLKKGGVAWLDGTSVPAGMTVRAFLPPGVLRAVR